MNPCRQEGSLPYRPGLPQDKGAVLISVADNGPGLNPEDREKVFEPFFNSRATSLGISLGLSYAYAVIKDHQGQITVHSPVPPEYAPKPAGSGNSHGPGTQFLIELPVRLEKTLEAEIGEPAKLLDPPLLPL